MNVIDKINESQINPNIPKYCTTIRVDVKIIEGKRDRRRFVVARRGSFLIYLNEMVIDEVIKKYF